MRIFTIAVFLTLAVPVAATLAQEGMGSNASKKQSTVSELAPGVSSAGTVPATADMWFYEQQLREYLNPKLAVRRKAEFATRQRQQRLAAMRWFGFSNLRPAAAPDPFNGDYSPCWTGADVLHPFQWSGCGFNVGCWYYR